LAVAIRRPILPRSLSLPPPVSAIGADESFEHVGNEGRDVGGLVDLAVLGGVAIELVLGGRMSQRSFSSRITSPNSSQSLSWFSIAAKIGSSSTATAGNASTGVDTKVDIAPRNAARRVVYSMVIFPSPLHKRRLGATGIMTPSLRSVMARRGDRQHDGRRINERRRSRLVSAALSRWPVPARAPWAWPLGCARLGSHR